MQMLCTIVPAFGNLKRKEFSTLAISDDPQLPESTDVES